MFSIVFLYHQGHELLGKHTLSQYTAFLNLQLCPCIFAIDPSVACMAWINLRQLTPIKTDV